MASEKARELRLNSTDAERRLWQALRDRQLEGYKFRRQRPIGPFIADFACIEHRLIVELDGSQHADSSYDAIRTAWLQQHGWRVLRFWDNDVLLNTGGVAEAILTALQAELNPHPARPSGLPPSPASGRGLRARR